MSDRHGEISQQCYRKFKELLEHHQKFRCLFTCPFFLHAQAGAECERISNPELQDHGAEADPAETAPGAERQLPPAAHANQNLRPVLPVRNTLPDLPQRLHVLHPSAAQVRENPHNSYIRFVSH